jgi:two-component system chemotaxis sensor kinase CheA
MRPFAEACEALPRTVRDLAVTSGKDVELVVTGEGVELDRGVLDALREALLHLVRNAVDHGIEAPAERERAGKPRRGRVTVAAGLLGERASVTVADDGAGLDVAAIRAILARHGLPAPADDRELGRVLLEGGLSTSGAVTAISGRGVGLDIVRAAVARIRGTVTVAWRLAGGTTFTIECPPTLATIRAVMVAVGPHWFAIPTAHVERLLRLRWTDVRQAEGRDVIATPDAPVPLVSLGQLVSAPAARPSDRLFAVVLRAGARRLAVAVDELVNEGEVVLRPLAAVHQRLAHFGGATILASGRVALVLDPVSLVAAGLADRTGAGLAAAAPAAAGGAERRRILVVDDSITTRALEQSILEAAGYEVLTAVDGADAWRQLQERGADLVVADVEMPRMDGFALCEAIRGSARLKGTPVVLVTALESPEHRARGLEAGADAYLGKSSFDQHSLLEVIEQLVGQGDR